MKLGWDRRRISCHDCWYYDRKAQPLRISFLDSIHPVSILLILHMVISGNSGHKAGDGVPKHRGTVSHTFIHYGQFGNASQLTTHAFELFFLLSMWKQTWDDKPRPQTSPESVLGVNLSIEAKCKNTLMVYFTMECVCVYMYVYMCV